MSVSVAQEWRRGWTTPFSGLLGLYLGVTFLYSVGTFMAPLQADLGWSRQDVSIGVTILGLTGALMHAFAGFLSDRIGARKVGLTAILLYCTSLVALSRIGSDVWQWWIASSFVGLTFGGLSSVVWTTGVISQFDRSRGAAVAVVQLGPALALTTLPLAATWLIMIAGWRSAYVAIAVFGVVAVFPAVLAGFHDRRFGKNKRSTLTLSSSRDYGFLRSRQFWMLGAAILLAVSGLSGLSVHYMPMLGDRGLTPIAAAGVASFIGLGSMTGRVSCGLALDRYPSAFVGSIAFALPSAAAITLLLVGGSPVGLALAAFLVGLSLGAEVDVAAYVTSRIFGLREYGTVFGLFVASMSAATGIGPWVAGRLHDVSGSYSQFHIYVILCSIVATILMLSLGKLQPIDAPERSDLDQVLS